MNKPRGVLIAGNWKMNHGPSEAEKFFQTLRIGEAQAALKRGSLRACVIPPAVSLEKSISCVSKLSYPITVAAQNAHWEKKGAFTGELSGPLLQEIGISWALIGHSERRQFFGETDETVRKRSESLLTQGLQIILCVGETREQREKGETPSVLTRQIRGAMPEAGKGSAAFLNGQLILAYEPVWAIGTGLTASPAQAEEAHQILRKLLWDDFGMEASARTPILYGGSVTPENIDSLLECANVDGALVGGASLKPESYAALVEAGARISRK